MFPRSIRFGWNAHRKCKAKTNFAAYGKPNLGEYAAKPNLPDLGLKRLFFYIDAYGAAHGFPCQEVHLIYYILFQ